MAKRGLSALFVALLISLTFVLPAHASFSDVNDPKLSAMIDELVAKNIVSGFVDGTYRPAKPVTRSQMAKLITLSKNYPLASAAADTMSFGDVLSTHWATTYIKASAAVGIVNGYPDGTFRPESQITRGELARMLRRATEMPIVKPAQPTYKDTASGYWAFGDIETMVYYGIMGGYPDGTFKPAQAATRGEIAAALYKMLKADLQPPVQDASSDTTETQQPAITPATDGKIIITIDPGHGGKDSGAIAKSNGLQEKDVNLAVALKLRDLLQSAGYEVIMTRSTDVFVSLDERSRISNDAMADIFISVHHNSNTTDTAAGTAVYSYPGSIEGAVLARLIQDELVKQFGWAGVAGKDDGIKTANFAVLRGTIAVAALAESAYLSNPSEAALMATDDFRQREAQAVYDGVVNYLNR